MLYFEERAQKFEYKLNDTDDQIIEYIISHKQEAVLLSIQQLAAKFYTVPNTITRLSKKLEFDGFSHMKNSLKEELNADEAIEEDHLTYNIKKTVDLIDYKHLKSIVKFIQEANRVVFIAVGDTAPMCEVMVKNLKVSNKQAEYYIHRHEVIHEVNQLDKTDVAFFISLSGETQQMLEIAHLVKKRGVRLISLTHFNENSLQKIADVKLYCYSPRKMINKFNVTDKTPAMIVLRALAETYWNISD